MRIIAGIAKSRKLKMIRGISIRPMLDSIKESIFNIIRDRIIGADVLDLYAGSGNLCLEAISRGANSGVLIDKSGVAYKLINENACLVGFNSMIKIIRMDVFDAIDFLGKNAYKFRIVFSDPPYNCKLSENTLKNIAENNILDKDAIIIARHHKKEDIPTEINIEQKQALKLFDRRVYGDAIISFYIAV